jgi:hypothetical protein
LRGGDRGSETADRRQETREGEGDEGYTKIRDWELADDLTVAVYEVTRLFPKEELYALTNQMRRASYFVPVNTSA